MEKRQLPEGLTYLKLYLQLKEQGIPEFDNTNNPAIMVRGMNDTLYLSEVAKCAIDEILDVVIDLVASEELTHMLNVSSREHIRNYIHAPKAASLYSELLHFERKLITLKSVLNG